MLENEFYETLPKQKITFSNENDPFFNFNYSYASNNMEVKLVD